MSSRAVRLTLQAIQAARPPAPRLADAPAPGARDRSRREHELRRRALPARARRAAAHRGGRRHGSRPRRARLPDRGRRRGRDRRGHVAAHRARAGAHRGLRGRAHRDRPRVPAERLPPLREARGAARPPRLDRTRQPRVRLRPARSRRGAPAPERAGARSATTPGSPPTRRVLRGVAIGEHCIVGARSLVTSDVPPHTLVFGQPARPRGTVGDRSRAR